jgi:hypothetical protein
MPKAVMIVYSRPSDPAREDDYNDWYDNVHLREVCDVPGFVSARRYRVSDVQSRPQEHGLPEYLAIYELESDDLQASVDELMARVADGRVKVTDALQTTPRALSTVYELRTERTG